jgi:dolichol-phosphate mannosyltransferase
MVAMPNAVAAGNPRVDLPHLPDSAGSPAAVAPRPAPELAVPELAIVVPTFNESANVQELVRLVAHALAGEAWEILFVDDDSPDGTAAEVRRLASMDPRVRVIQRLGRRGLSSACIEGMMATAAPYVAVMDADLQHDEALLPRMLERLRTGGADLVVGSRYVDGGGVGAWEESRQAKSRLATRLARRVLPADVQDPMSGFFMARRDVLEGRVRKLSGIGFKILLDLLTADPAPLRVQEMPYQFRNRHAGESKLDASVAWDFLMLLADRAFGRYVPARFLGFAAVGGGGVLVHFAVLTALLKGAGLAFAVAQAAATGVAMVFNYAVNNALTYRDRRLVGARWWLGLLSFAVVCGVGAAANVGVAAWLFDHNASWAVAGLAGILVGAVWNYALTGAYTWGTPRRAAA